MDGAVADPAVIRRHLLDLASDWRGGVQRVCFDEVVAKSGIPEAALFDAFGGRDNLIRAYLRSRFTGIQDRMMRELPRFGSARQRIIGVFEIQGLSFTEPGFQQDGLEFKPSTDASLPGALLEEASTEYRDWLHNLFFDLAYAAQVAHPEELAGQLVVIYHGTRVTAWMDRRPDIAAAACALARTVVAAAADPSAM
jgi:AcrR family transcriptional regulator